MRKNIIGGVLGTGFVLLGIAALTLFWLQVAKSDPSVAREHGPMETFQAAALLLGTMAFGFLAFHSHEAGQRCFFSALALFYLTFLLLEFDVRPFQKPVLTFLLNGAVRNLALLVAWTIVLTRAYRKKEGVFSVVRHWIRSYSALWLIASGFCWIGGAVMEKASFVSNSQFGEELFEVHACWLMAWAAFQALRTAGSNACNQTVPLQKQSVPETSWPSAASGK